MGLSVALVVVEPSVSNILDSVKKGKASKEGLEEIQRIVQGKIKQERKGSKTLS
jgi:hypothetical protein